jgi:hypothetical protein
MRILKQKNGQFIMIAVLMIAIMMVSIVGVLYSAVTYYRHERWEEYLTILDNIKIGTTRLVEISLADYAKSLDNETLVTNLNKWQTNLTRAYPGFGVVLEYSNATISNGSQTITSLTGDTQYFSNANAKIDVDITSVGLEGYSFVASAFLGVTLNATYINGGDDLLIYLEVEKEGSIPVPKLKKDNFVINGTMLSDYPSTKLTHAYYMDNDVVRIVYKIIVRNLTPKLSTVRVDVIDSRYIEVTANSSVT